MERAISASEANQHFSEMLRDVQQGEEFVVMSRGRPVARVIPVQTSPDLSSIQSLLSYLKALPNRQAGEWHREDLYN